ncbi:Enhancer of polycomb-like protein 1 [Nosema granulosis]|uniref:Enhancer of polycomb-like protein 1 n=1 Tax=Nosema granulosis TaxID=83296 RepID=A0A9P6H121_9MICR|nr:Enhancer of polycomb-like protein 1 [Nosema granulosis]
MVPKRKRNVKINTTENYPVVDIEKLDLSHLEEFTLPPIDTGMEAEEEKEIHLKNIIDSGRGNIPIPVIKKMENPAKILYKNDGTNSLNSCRKDVTNQYYMDTRDFELCHSLGITEEDYLSVVEEIEDDAHVKVENEDKLVETRSSCFDYGRLTGLYPQSSNCKQFETAEVETMVEDTFVPEYSANTETDPKSEPVLTEWECLRSITPVQDVNQTKKLSDEIKNQIKAQARYKRLIRDEDKSHPSYVCFRRRVLKPSRKNRRSEAQTVEKVVRLNSELGLLTKMSNLRKKVCELDDKIYDINFELSKAISRVVQKYGEKGQKKVARFIKNTKTVQAKTDTPNQGDIFKDILFDRDRIRMLNKRLRLARDNIDEEEIEKEAIGYTNYLRSIHENIYPQ